MNSHHDSPSEDGREVPEAVAYRYQCVNSNGDPLPGWHYSDDPGTLGLREPLITLAQHSRIVAAKDAEIAKFKEANRELAKSNVRRRDKIVELMLKLDAQPARQVVVMPEPLSRDDYSVGMYGRAMIRGYESCRREVARLNRNPIPVELINRALQTPIGLKEFADREAAQNELRALLGKSTININIWYR